MRQRRRPPRFVPFALLVLTALASRVGLAAGVDERHCFACSVRVRSRRSLRGAPG